MPATRPTLAVAKRLFKKRNPNVAFRAQWERKPVKNDNGFGAGYVSSVRFTADGYKPRVMRLYSDRDGIALF